MLLETPAIWTDFTKKKIWKDALDLDVNNKRNNLNLSRLWSFLPIFSAPLPFIGQKGHLNANLIFQVPQLPAVISIILIDMQALFSCC